MLENELSLYLSYDEISDAYDNYVVIDSSDNLDDVLEKLQYNGMFLGDMLLKEEPCNMSEVVLEKIFGDLFPISKYYKIKYSQRKADQMRNGFIYHLYDYVKELYLEVNQDNYQEVEKLCVFGFDYSIEILNYINQADIVSSYNLREGEDKRFDIVTFDNVLTAIDHFFYLYNDKIDNIKSRKNNKINIK